MLKAIIIDDERPARENLFNLIKLCSTQLEVVASFEKPTQAITYLEEETVNCIFLDIEMPGMDGFRFLEALGHTQARVIFTTAHSEYAVKAFRADAIDYLLKPIDMDELETAIDRVRVDVMKTVANKEYVRSVRRLIEQQTDDKISPKITLPITHGFKIAQSDNIIRVEADGRYCRIFFKETEPELVTRNLGYFEEVLDRALFIRVHNSHLINLKHMIEFLSINGGTVRMADGNEITIAKRRLKEFKDATHAYCA